jgi:hypothetical protein
LRGIGTKSHDRDRGRGDEPIFGAGIHELAADLRTAMRLGIVPPLDADYMAAAMVGAALEVGVAMIKREPLERGGRDELRDEGLPRRDQRLGNAV